LGAGLKPKPQGEYLGQKVAKLEKSASDTYRKVLGVKSQELKNVEIRKGGNLDNAFKVMADEGLPLSQTVEGNIETRPAREILKTKVSNMSQELDNYLKQDQSNRFSLDDIAKQAKRVVEERTTNAIELEEAKSDIDNFIKSEKIRYGKVVNNGVVIPAEKVDATTLNKIKQGMWSVGYDQMKPTKQSNARKIGRAIAETLEKTYPNSPIEKLNKKMSDYLTALSILETPRRSPTGGFGRGAAMVSGGIVGGLVGQGIPIIGPALGGVGGYQAGGKLYEASKSPSRRSKSATKQMAESQKIQMLNPQVKQILQQILSGKYQNSKIGF
jgi:hypothetical protein